MHLQKICSGQQEGQDIFTYILTNSSGQRVVLYNYGLTIQSWTIPVMERNVDILLGRDGFEGYLEDHPNLGCIIGRYANRIREGHLYLNNQNYSLSKNLHGHHLHGGYIGFGNKIWTPLRENTSDSFVEIVFSHKSIDGDEGYPGTLQATISIRFTEKNELLFDMYASTDKTTVCNLTNHCYFNLGNSETILRHLLQINASAITETNDELIPTGRFINVGNSDYDFRHPRSLSILGNEGDAKTIETKGYDVNYILDETRDAEMDPVATLIELENRLQLDVYTTLPGLQLYTGNWLEGVAGKRDSRYRKFAGICLEAQYFPDAPHHSHFPSPVLEPGETYHHVIRYKVSKM